MPTKRSSMLGPDPSCLTSKQRRFLVGKLARSSDPGVRHLADLYAHCPSFYPGWQSGLPREGEASLPARVSRPVTIGGASIAAACMEV